VRGVRVSIRPYVVVRLAPLLFLLLFFKCVQLAIGLRAVLVREDALERVVVDPLAVLVVLLE
jgi:hypothetical protein